MRGSKVVIAALLALAMLLISAFAVNASVRMRVTGKRDRKAVVVHVPRRATLLATGNYAEALGVPDPSRFYGPIAGPVFYGYGYGGFPGYGVNVFISPPPYVFGRSPLDPPFTRPF